MQNFKKYYNVLNPKKIKTNQDISKLKGIDLAVWYCNTFNLKPTIRLTLYLLFTKYNELIFVRNKYQLIQNIKQEKK